MQLIRTTVRLRKPLKHAAERRALQLNLSFQALLEKALESYLRNEHTTSTRKIVFRDRDLGQTLDNLTREDFYVD